MVSGSASAVERHVDTDPDFDYSALHTFGWMPRALEIPDAERRAPLLDQLLREVVAETLESKGLNEAPEDQADLLFIYYIDPRRNLDLYSRDYVTGDMAAWLSPLKNYKQAMSVVVMDGISRDHGRLVWRGVFAMKLDQPWTLAKKIRRVTAKLVSSIPIPKR